jgi:hypothetical protein
MSDKPVQMTIQGIYRGYSVSVSLECSLDSLDKAIDRLQARGIEPLTAAPAAPASQGSQGSKQPVERFEGVFLRSSRPDAEKGPALKITLRGEGEDVRVFDLWKPEESEKLLTVVRANVSRLHIAYTTRQNGRYTNYSVQSWQLVA